MKLSDFDFDLPEQLIATRPVKPRSASRMLVAQGDKFSDRHAFDLPTVLRSGDLLVLNDTKVIPARLHGTRARLGADGPTQARMEVTLLEPDTDGNWRVFLRPLKKIRDGEVIRFSDDLCAELVGREDGVAVLRFNQLGGAFEAALQDTGLMPLPPYIAQKRAADAQDQQDYQTIWAKNRGAVAAPTASLHFDDTLMDALKAQGVETTFVTLHVGGGTFLPVKTDDISAHKMHSEWGHVSGSAAAKIAQTKADGGRVIPVGTTALRLIETAARSGQIAPWEGDTDIFITPGFQFQVTDALITNFHLPRSTLIMLVAALMGASRTRRLYDHAIRENYRFFSYGDASFLEPMG